MLSALANTGVSQRVNSIGLFQQVIALDNMRSHLLPIVYILLSLVASSTASSQSFRSHSAEVQNIIDWYCGTSKNVKCSFEVYEQATAEAKPQKSVIGRIKIVCEELGPYPCTLFAHSFFKQLKESSARDSDCHPFLSLANGQCMRQKIYIETADVCYTNRIRSSNDEERCISGRSMLGLADSVKTLADTAGMEMDDEKHCLHSASYSDAAIFDRSGHSIKVSDYREGKVDWPNRETKFELFDLVFNFPKLCKTAYWQIDYGTPSFSEALKSEAEWNRLTVLVSVVVVNGVFWSMIVVPLILFLLFPFRKSAISAGRRRRIYNPEAPPLNEYGEGYGKKKLQGSAFTYERDSDPRKVKDSNTWVVFVHGLWSNCESAFGDWINSLPEDKGIQEALGAKPIPFVFNYYTPRIVRGSKFGFPDAAKQLLARLKSRDIQTEKVPLDADQLIFVGHSAGGLVLCEFFSEYRNDLKNKRIGIVLMGSPMSGSPYAKLLSFLKNRFIESLEPSSNYSTDLVARFERAVGLFKKQGGNVTGIEIMEDTFMHGLLPPIVDADTQVALFERSVIGGSSHSSVAKPSSHLSESHVLVRDYLARRFAYLHQAVKDPSQNR
jgi:pimeloyl-ACP methyl ester carboxylesterase